MEQHPPPAYNPHLQRVLKSYQNAAMRSLSGPSSYMSAWGDGSKFSTMELEEYRKAALAVQKKAESEGLKALEYDPLLQPPPFPIQQMPLLIPMDSTRSEKGETLLEEEKIACFIVGGEKRLCLPQILNTVLRDFSLQQINQVCDDLHIFCSRCNAEQLEILKITSVLPMSAPSCGLITKTDAERLCNTLIHRNPEKSIEPPSQNSFQVYHECFGKCRGVLSPELYKTQESKCVECTDCRGVFSPQKFVCHSHKALENRTCHWGFDSQNWRYYLLLSKEQECRSHYQDALDEIKAKFDTNNKFKRKLKVSIDDKSDIKRVKTNEDQQAASSWTEQYHRHMSAFQPWPGSKLLPPPPGIMRDALGGRVGPQYLQTGPPVLLNPERVVPISETDSEPHFAPNVTLAPPSEQKKTSSNPGEIDVGKPREEHWDTTDTDSSFGESGPNSPNKSFSVADDPYEILDQQTDLLRKALNGKVQDTHEARKLVVDEFRQLGMKLILRLNASLEAKKSLQKEIEKLQLQQQDPAETLIKEEIIDTDVQVDEATEKNISLLAKQLKKKGPAKYDLELFKGHDSSLNGHQGSSADNNQGSSISDKERQTPSPTDIASLVTALENS